MTFRRRIEILVLLLMSLLCVQCGEREAAKISDDTLLIPQIEYAPRHYVCYKADHPLAIDGRLDETEWQKAAWTDMFVDIEGDLKPIPRFETRAKMLWDDTYIYFCADMKEPHVWGTLTDRDAVIYHDNDFEVFIDPDGDTHEYYELEVNALGTEWDLLLVKPYRDGAPAINAWDIQGLKTAVHINGTLNNPRDVDSGWSIEIAMPWEVLSQCAHKSAPPEEGDQWRVNFSRVEWQHAIENGKYVKAIDLKTGTSFPENNWVWSPQGLIAMHYPEMWGFVQFTEKTVGSEPVEFTPDPTDLARWAMRELYYAERTHFLQYGQYTQSVSCLDLEEYKLPGYDWPPTIETTVGTFEARLTSVDGMTILCITHDGDIREIENGK